MKLNKLKENIILINTIKHHSNFYFISTRSKLFFQSKKEFRYYFNENTAEAKLAFQNIFKNPKRAKELWELNPDLFKSLDKNIIEDFESLVELAETGKLINYINWVY
ncbi:hypothetical protein FEZ18_07825 [Oceanihabitans sp. IOP_32]|uniref:hypothetical protein n=1 Tax=Oceanihabitans sp. IOP_32 TaxID=2529032 RepID=UPI00129365EA|nr:hypothetical protein [Oceanihabitans sp. IOP_32]QFZ54708.1 hypothetical protein FEZ18_07825 [Oceanihabitans sp. IOP_32]